MEKKTYRAQTYVIPENYNDAGKFAGLFGLRNLVEAASVILPLALLELQLKVDLAFKAIVCTLTLLPLAILCLTGIGHYTLFQWLGYFIGFLVKPKRFHMKRIGRYLEDIEKEENYYGRKGTKKKTSARTIADKKHFKWHDRNKRR